MIYQKFQSTDIVPGRTQAVSSGFFNDGNYSVLESSFTVNSNQIIATGSNNFDILNGLYYWNVYYNNQVHFSVAYGDLTNSGSSAYDISTTKIFPFQANYKSYANLLLSPAETKFSFLTGSYNGEIKTVYSDSIFIINFSSNLYKNRVDQGLLQFSLTNGNLTKTISFIDDSTIVNKVSDVYNIIEGTISDTTNVPNPVTGSGGAIIYKSYGLFYPKTGIVILNAPAIGQALTDNLNVGMDYYNSNGDLISGTGNYNGTAVTGSGTAYNLYQSAIYLALKTSNTNRMKVRKSEFIPTTQYYVRVQNDKFNYTNNPSFISDGTDGLTKGTIKIAELRTNPTTYITTIGLYNDANELIAVAKLSSPSAKSFDNEYLIKVNLAY